MSEKRDKLCSLTYTCMITVCYLGAIGLCRTVLFSNILKIDDKVINSVSLGIFSLVFLLGPLSLPFFQKLILKLTYKAVFFITSLANIFSMTLYIVVIEQKPKDIYLIATILIFEAISAPFMAIFYCAFNYYIRSMSNKVNVGIYFGVAYSLFSMQNLIGDIYVIFEGKMFEYNQYFYYPMLGVSLLITFLYWFIKEPDSLSKSATKQSIDLEQKLNEHLYGSLMDDDNQKNYANNNEYGNQFRLIWKIPKQYPQFVYLIPTIISIGMFAAFSVVYSQDMIEPNYTNVQYLKPALVTNLSIHGIGQFLGGILIGLLSYSYSYLNLLMALQIFGATTYILSVNLIVLIKDCW
ncbi:unnamed protein product (macronuclear) [Paramecium tetraurelia]|uniref:Major facilitator superfamily (MFS) profile domain-containing protein n=1 Tax=Paramecium tetraurelia TaxID=5888 RepID=A0DMS1_PARTE|nr:uncharacterized protein GSPATT00018542001 [Paramecium tetraurelia]CAK84338.1 unnamed protein product [Paramecium tetraurelia]|eukprot:XP_001451735.1 hypothetical protein (macronuclear) [Paramecium tetraurelia strain d4-2]